MDLEIIVAVPRGQLNSEKLNKFSMNRYLANRGIVFSGDEYKPDTRSGANLNLLGPNPLKIKFVCLTPQAIAEELTSGDADIGLLGDDTLMEFCAKSMVPNLINYPDKDQLDNSNFCYSYRSNFSLNYLSQVIKLEENVKNLFFKKRIHNLQQFEQIGEISTGLNLRLGFLGRKEDMNSKQFNSLAGHDPSIDIRYDPLVKYIVYDYADTCPEGLKISTEFPSLAFLEVAKKVAAKNIYSFGITPVRDLPMVEIVTSRHSERNVFLGHSKVCFEVVSSGQSMLDYDLDFLYPGKPAYTPKIGAYKLKDSLPACLKKDELRHHFSKEDWQTIYEQYDSKILEVSKLLAGK